MKTDVYIVKCESYDTADEKIGEMFALMGGVGKFVANGEKITLKANLLAAEPPEKAVSTHPAVIAAVGAIIKREGAVPLIADSPGSGHRYSEATLKKLYTTCGMYDAAERAGIDLNFDTGHDEVSFPQGKAIKRIDVIKPITQADGVFNICKMKTHMLMSMTGAVKNNFGIIPGLSKIGFHARFRDKSRFADMLLDLELYVSPRLSIMDAVIAMEGQGPGASGTPRRVGLILASTSSLAIDVVAAEIMGLPLEYNPVLKAAQRRAIMPNRLEHVNIIGEEISLLRIPDYKFPATVKVFRQTAGSNEAAGGRSPAVQLQFPSVLKEACVGCGVCRDSCPQKMITIVTMKGKKQAVINTKKCIRCYCCHELCPHKAIEIR